MNIRSLVTGSAPAAPVARVLSISAFAAGFVVLFAPALARAQSPQVTLYLNNYGQAPSGVSATPAQAPMQGPSGAGAAYQGGAALAQVAAYQQYLLYLSLAREGALGPNPGPNPAQYFTNGAAVTTVPSAGQPGSAYFSNGAEATRLPPPAPAAAAAPSAAAALPPPAGSALPPFWWTGSSAPPAPATAAPPPVPAPSAAPAPAEPPTQGPVMSFEEWLLSMGAQPPAEPAEQVPEIAAAEMEAPIVEPAENAYEVRKRATYAPPEKARERAATNEGSRGLASFVVGAFAVGLLLGGLAMWRAGFRMGPPGGAASG
jgi:hypothetical protein